MRTVHVLSVVQLSNTTDINKTFKIPSAKKAGKLKKNSHPHLSVVSFPLFDVWRQSLSWEETTKTIQV